MEYINGALDKLNARHESPSFFFGSLGIYALAAVIYSFSNKPKSSEFARKWFLLAKEYLQVPQELLYGKSGILYSILFLSEHLPCELSLLVNLKELSSRIIQSIWNCAQPISDNSCKWWEWHGKFYFGAAHGIAGILTILMKFASADSIEAENIRFHLNEFIRMQTADGNFPSSAGSKHTDLYQFCHGAPGIILCLCEAYKLFLDPLYMDLAKSMSILLCKYGVLRKGFGLCHGISGNALAFAAIYEISNDVTFLQYCRKFLAIASQRKKLEDIGYLLTPDNPYSLFEGVAGLALAILQIESNIYSFPCFSDATNIA